MKIVAYVARRYEHVTRRVLGTCGVILTCPPLHDADFEPALLSGYDLVVFNLHGFPNSPAWLGGDRIDEGVPALKAATLAECDLGGAGVFAINCHLGDEDSPMRVALIEAGAGWIVSGAGVNYAGWRAPVGADVLLKWFVRVWAWPLRLGLSVPAPERALAWAKRFAARSAPQETEEQRQALADALEFEVWRV